MRKIIWLILSSMMVAALLLSSCAPAVTEEEEVVAPPKEEEEVVTEEEVAPPLGEPTYGGVINLVGSWPDFAFDQAYTIRPYYANLALTHEELLAGDWARGPAGTGEVMWQFSPFNPAFETGCLAESWEIPDEETIVFHIRKGVHWQDKPPLNGRELTADDVVYTLNRQFFGDIPFGAAGPEIAVKSIESIEATDKYTVVIKSPAYIPTQLRVCTELVYIMAPELAGPPPGDYRDLNTCIGTGPFMLIDYVPSTSVSFVKNPNYWMKDPLHPENTLPYVDGINMLIVPDASTRQAALRVGKTEILGELSWEDKDSLVKTNPELKWLGGLGKGTLISMRTDRSDLPFQYQIVRRALAMGIDRQAMVNDLYGGNAEVFAFPILPVKEFSDMFTPLDELSESIQEQYEYNPEKAKQLLAEAGYPDGFKTTITCTPENADMASILKAYWGKTDVEVELQVRDQASHKAVSSTHGGMYLGGYPQDDPQAMLPFRQDSIGNTSLINDPYIEDVFHSKLEQYGYLEWDKLSQTLKGEVVPYILEKCWYIDLPTPYSYTFWQPWLKGYHGEREVGFRSQHLWTKFVWLDQELKKEMTGR